MKNVTEGRFNFVDMVIVDTMLRHRSTYPHFPILFWRDIPLISEVSDMAYDSHPVVWHPTYVLGSLLFWSSTNDGKLFLSIVDSIISGLPQSLKKKTLKITFTFLYLKTY